jgi:hypothetical protein
MINHIDWSNYLFCFALSYIIMKILFFTLLDRLKNL